MKLNLWKNRAADGLPYGCLSVQYCLQRIRTKVCWFTVSNTIWKAILGRKLFRLAFCDKSLVAHCKHYDMEASSTQNMQAEIFVKMIRLNILSATDFHMAMLVADETKLLVAHYML